MLGYIQSRSPIIESQVTVKFIDIDQPESVSSSIEEASSHFPPEVLQISRVLRQPTPYWDCLFRCLVYLKVFLGWLRLLEL